MSHHENRFDVAIIGSGIAGSALAAILARQGLKVILFEASSHPKFAIGESMILETSEVMRSMAELYDVPELAYFSSENYFDHIGTSHGVKRHFSYLHHTEGQPLDKQHSLQAVIPKQPHGHELHLYRQDTDYFLMTVAIRYGATVLQKTCIQSVEIDQDGVQLTTEKGQHFLADYVVDAGGFRSLLAEKFDLRHHDLKTHSRAIFTHMVEVPCYHQVSGSKEAYHLPFLLSEGTLHHVFKGGWLWVIPFDNHRESTNSLCSVGLMLDPRVYPMQSDLSPEAEFYQFIERFPGIAKQFRQAKAVQGWKRTGRIQYSTQQVVGDRFCLLGQAAGFIDPLFSKGLYMALTCTAVLAERLLTARAKGDYSALHFQPLERLTLACIQANDNLVANAYKSFSDYKLWAPFSVLWLLGAYLELVKLTSNRALATDRQDYYRRLQSLKLVGGSFAEFERISQQIYNRLDRLVVNDPTDIALAGQQIKEQLNQIIWMPSAFKAVLHGKNHLPTNKLHPRLLRPKHGFLGNGSYRNHFFEDMSLLPLARFFFHEKAKYARPAVQLRRTIKLWQRGLEPFPHWWRIVVVSGAMPFAIATLIWLNNFIDNHRRTNLSSRSVIETNSYKEKTASDLGSFIRTATDSQFVCGSQIGQIIDTTAEVDY
ncbi:MAG: NAD(P)/FAD-dependent oxidoreductase [Cyanobacteria bacterium J06635_15]